MIEIIRKQIAQLVSGELGRRGVIDWAAPVPAFGDCVNSKIATVGINPSNLEFQSQSGEKLIEQERRFPTLDSLGIQSWSEAKDKDLEKIRSSGVHYFQNKPYTRWFNQLEFLLAETGLSFYNVHNSACHLDLVPFSTAKKWANLTASDTKYLKDTCRNSLHELVDCSKFKLLILNGQQVVNEFEDLFSVKLLSKPMPEWDLPRKSGVPVAGISYCGEIPRKKVGIIKIVGFNHNIQSSYGITNQVKISIRKWIADQWTETNL
jgi:hypothetical protein